MSEKDVKEKGNGFKKNQKKSLPLKAGELLPKIVSLSNGKEKHTNNNASTPSPLPKNTLPWTTKTIMNQWGNILKAFASTLNQESAEEQQEAFNESLKENGIPLNRPFKLLYDPKIGLGMQCRLNIAIEVLKEKIKENIFVDKSEKQKESLSKVMLAEALEISETALTDLTQLGTMKDTRPSFIEKKVQSLDLIGLLVKNLNQHFKENYQRSLPVQTLKIDDYTNRIFKGEFAPNDFANFLRNGWQKLISSNELLLYKPYLSKTEARKNNVTEILTCLKTLHNGKPILTVTANDAPTGLTAFAAHLYDKILEKKIAPVLYIPTGHKAPRDTYAGMAYLAAKLYAFYRCEPITEAKEADSPSLLADQLLFIRKSIASQPSIVIFDGYSAAQNCYPHLHRLIRDEALDMVSHLVQPWLGDSNQTIDIENFKKTYFLILADGKLDFLKTQTHENSWQLETPNWDHRAAVTEAIFKVIKDNQQNDKVSTQTIQSEIVVPSYLKNGIDNLGTLPRESIIASVYSLLLIKERFKADIPEKWEELLNQDDAEEIDDFFKEFVKTIKKTISPEHLLILRLIAISNSGIRRDTLLRCMYLWQKATREHSLKKHLVIDEKFIQETTIDYLINKHSLSALFVERADELISPLGKLSDHPFEYPDIADVVSISAIKDINKSIDLRYNDLRNAIIKDIDKDEPFCKYLLHRIIAEEALRQYTIILRHSNAVDSTHLSIYRRGLETLLHGFFSLPLKHNIAKVDTWPSLKGIGAIPQHPIEAYYYLYIELYRNVIEVAPTYALSRIHACDKEKLDLLLLANDPERAQYDCSPIELKIPRLFDFTLKSDDYIFSDDTKIKLLQDHLLAIARCAYRVDKYDICRSVNSIATRLGKKSLFKANSEKFAFSLKKVELDFRMLMESPSKIKKRCLGFLAEIGFKAKYIEKIQKTIDACFNKNGKALLKPNDLENNLQGIFQELITDINKEKKYQATSKAPFSQLLDMLYRYAEILMLISDRLETQKARIFRSFMEAHSVFFLANLIRQHIFNHAPLNFQYQPNADALRNAVRLELKLSKDIVFLKQTSDDPLYDTWKTHFIRSARYYSNLYTLYSGKEMVPDQVSQLLLETAFVRILTPLSDKKHNLQIAYNLISRADMMLINLRDRPRLRMRQILEKCKCSRLLAEIYAKEKPLTEKSKMSAIHYHKIFEFSAYQLKSLANDQTKVLNINSNEGLWERLAKKQMRLLEAFPLNKLFQN